MSKLFQDREEHDAYGLASFSRVSGHARMFGSEFDHQHYMTLTIKRGFRCRNLGRYWYMDGQELIRVRMSEAQWVELVTRPNMGVGTPVTLEHVGMKQMPKLPAVKTERQRAEAEFKEDCQEIAKRLNDTIARIQQAIENGKTGKTELREILGMVQSSKQQISNSLPFVEQQFAEAMETTVTNAKVEVESYITGALQRIGLEQVKNGTSPLLLPSDKEAPNA